jgi:hypothetical protein
MPSRHIMQIFPSFDTDSQNGQTFGNMKSNIGM